jgi:hypothetical protein
LAKETYLRTIFNFWDGVDMYRLFWGNEGLCDLFTEARSAEVNKSHIPEVPQNNVLIFHIAIARSR